MKKIVYLPHYMLSIVLESNLIKAAYLGAESTRKFNSLGQFMENVFVESSREQIIFFEGIRELNFHPVVVENPLYHWIEKSKNIVINDYHDCCGISSNARSCDERRDYYNKVGMSAFYESRTNFYVSLFILNHISFFGSLSKEMFFSGELTGRDRYVNYDLFTKRMNRYHQYLFKAPAYYVRAVIQSYGR